MVELLLLLPFLNNGGIGKITNIVTHTVGLYDKLSICAFNIWYLITRSNPYFIKDTDTYFLLSYKAIGFIMFAIAGLIVWIPLAKKIWQPQKKQASI